MTCGCTLSKGARLALSAASRLQILADQSQAAKVQMYRPWCSAVQLRRRRTHSRARGAPESALDRILLVSTDDGLVERSCGRVIDIERDAPSISVAVCTQPSAQALSGGRALSVWGSLPDMVNIEVREILAPPGDIMARRAQDVKDVKDQCSSRCVARAFQELAGHQDLAATLR